MRNWFCRFFRNNSGNLAIIASVMMMPLITAIGASIDYTSLVRIRSNMQQAVDSAALASARELRLAGVNIKTIQTIAQDLVVANSASNQQQNLKVKANILSDKKGVTVSASLVWQPMILQHISNLVTPIVTTATARLSGSANVCILGLATSAPKSVFLDHHSTITGDNCGVYSNSTDPNAIRVDDKGKIKAKTICSSGGFTGSASAFSPRPITDCPPMPDPLIGRAEPTVGTCNYDKTEIVDQKKTLTPGVYCGGLKIAGNSNVTFKPGVYIIKGDKFIIQDNSKAVGKQVGFYLADDAAFFEFNENTTIELTAPTNGTMAGILMFESRSVVDGRKHQISSNNAKILIGTFYLSVSTLVISSKTPVASNSAYTAIIAHAVELTENPTLVLNANYDDTDIPVPEGLVGNKVRLTN